MRFRKAAKQCGSRERAAWQLFISEMSETMGRVVGHDLKTHELVVFVNNYDEQVKRVRALELYSPPSLPSDNQIMEVLDQTVFKYGIPETYRPNVSGIRFYHYTCH